MLLTMAILLSSAYAMSEECNRLMSGMHSLVSDLAKFRLDLDLLRALGESTAFLRTLESEYLKKEAEILVAFSKQGLTRNDLRARIESEIQEIQKVRQTDRVDREQAINDEKKELHRV